jgi:hypothetical protein
MATETREVSGFDRVAIKDYGELLLTQGTEESLTIDAPEDILPKIRAEVTNRKLVIGIEGGWLDKIGDAIAGTMRGKWIKYELSVIELRELHVLGALKASLLDITSDELALRLSGAGSINVEQLTTQDFTVELTGAGAVNVQGTAASQVVALSGAGSYFAPNLQSQQAKVRVSGVGSASVWAVDELKAAVQGVGSIDYHGSPTVTRSVTGLGSINHKERD